MSRVLHLHTQLRPTDSPSEVYARMAAAVPSDTLLAFGPGIYRELRQELRSIEAVAKWAAALATRLGRPVLINIPDWDGSSHTVTLSPRDWSPERLQGYVAGRHEELAEAFGPIERLRNMSKGAA
jgi:hypothetical protein